MNFDSRPVASQPQSGVGQLLPLRPSVRFCAACAAIDFHTRDGPPPHPMLQETDWGKTLDCRTEMWFYRCKECRAFWFRETDPSLRGSTWAITEMPICMR
jgi:hypothetical protein